MSPLQIATAACILIGALVLAISMPRMRGVLALAEAAEQKRRWRILSLLTGFFIVGYLAAVWVVYLGQGWLLELVAGAVFLGGAVFVFLVVRASQGVLADLQLRAGTERARAEELRVARDELQKTLEQLHLTNVDLTRSNRELEQFAYAASHDLQEPLRKVKAFGTLLAAEYRDTLGDEGSMYVERMHNAAERMSALIDDLLTFARVARHTEQFSRVDLKALANEVVNDLDLFIHERGGRVDVDDLPVIEAEPTLIRQLLQNLIVNALKFAREGVAPVVSLSAEVPGQQGEVPRCVLRVRDNGIGFEPRYAEKIFDIFQRLHGRAEYAGNGMGLAICRKIVNAHGGQIEAIGEPGAGATFVITLPLGPFRGTLQATAGS